MNSYRSTRGAAAAAVPICAFVALFLLLPLHAAVPGSTRLYEIGANRFVLRSGEEWVERGLLDARGIFHKTEESRGLSIVTVPSGVRGKTVISLDAWLAYQRLGSESLTHFSANPDGESYILGNRSYIDVAANSIARLYDGKLINLSTRGRASATDKLISGFVVDEQHRKVLVRAVGPGLAAFDVSDPMTDPLVTIYHGNVPVYSNGNWSTPSGAGETAAAAARVGAFPLAPASKDAALVIELAPGNYTAHVEPESGGAGSVLLEIYSVP
jgi:hypothetical protein